MLDSLSDALAVAAEEVVAGAPVDAMRRIAGQIAAHPSEPRLYRLGFEALCAAVVDPGPLSAWTAAEKTTLYRRLVLQEECFERPFIFHHGVASLLTSNNVETARSIAAEITPLLRHMLDEAKAASAPKPLVLLLLVMRALLDSRVPQREISALHLAHFPDFDPEDFALPYSVMFSPDLFGANRRDLIQRFQEPVAALAPEARLGLRHLLLMEWLGAPTPFSALDNADLMAALTARLHATAPPGEMAAARSLILRHWRPGGVLTAQALAALGFSANITTAAATIHRPKGQGSSATVALGRLNSRPWQALNALCSRSAVAAPMLAGKQRRIRVAVCVSGQLRGWRRALDSWRRAFLATAECKVFVHTWAKIGNASAVPTRATLPFEGAAFCREWRRLGMLEGYDAMQARYPTLFASLEASGRVDLEALKDAYETDSVIVEDDTEKQFCDFSNQDKMHYKIFQAHEQVKSTTHDFDLILRIRPDLSVHMIGFDWRDMADVCRSGPLLFCERPFGVHYGNPMIGDQLGIASPETMVPYALTWETHTKLAVLGLAQFPEALRGHVSLAQSCWISGIQTARVPMRSGTLLSPDPLSAHHIRTAIASDSAGRLDNIDRQLLQAVDVDRVRISGHEER